MTPSSHRRNIRRASLPLSSFTHRAGTPRMVHATGEKPVSGLARVIFFLFLFALRSESRARRPLLGSRNRFLSFLSRRPSRPFGTVRAVDRVLPVFTGPLYLLSVARVPDRISKAACRAATIGALIAEGCNTAQARIRVHFFLKKPPRGQASFGRKCLKNNDTQNFQIYLSLDFPRTLFWEICV